MNPDVRDRARFESGLVHAAVGLIHDRDGLDDVVAALPNSNTGHVTLTRRNVQRILRHNKPAASYLPLERSPTTSTNTSTEPDELEGRDFRFGTLSSLVGHRARNAYQPLPPWASENSTSSLREPPQQQIPTDRNHLTPSVSNGSGFYRDTNDNSSSSDDESKSSSSSSSSSESTSDGKERSSSSRGSSGSDTDSEENDIQSGLLSGGPSVPLEGLYHSGGGVASSLSQNQQQDNSSSTSSGSDDDDESSSSSFSSVDHVATGDLLSNSAPATSVGNLIPIEAGSDGGAGRLPLTSAVDEMKGLVLEPAMCGHTEPTDTNFERDSSAWVQLIRPEHAMGLSIQARFLRGITKAQQTQMLGLTAEKPTVVCLQVRCENLRNGGSSGPIRLGTFAFCSAR